MTWWTWAAFPITFVGLHKSSIRITQGKLSVEEVASVARESACVFPLLGMCNRLNDLNFDCKCLTWLKYPCILSSLASSSPPTWPTTSLKSKNIFTVFTPALWTMDIPSNKASYSASLFVAEKSNLNDFSMVSFSSEIRIVAPLRIPFGSLLYWHTPSNATVLTGPLTQPIFHPCVVLVSHSRMGFQWTRPPNPRVPIL